MCGFAASRCAGPAFGCPAAFGLVVAAPEGALSALRAAVRALASPVELTLIDRAHGIDRVGILRRFVGAVALDAGETQRKSAGIMRARLQIVEGDFDNQLGAHVHGHSIARRLAREKRRCLPGEHFVGHALEGLAEHDEPAVGIVTRGQMQVGQEALAAPIAPLRGEHDEVERVQPLDLEPCRGALARLVGRAQRFRHHAFVSAA